MCCAFLPSDIENKFIETILPHFKPLIINTIYRPPSQATFTEITDEHTTTQSTSHHVNQCFQISFCGTEYLIKSPIRVIFISSSISDHILKTFSGRVSQHSAIDARLSDHQLIYYKRKLSHIIVVKTQKRNQNSLLNNYSAENGLITFPNYEILWDEQGTWKLHGEINNCYWQVNTFQN